MAQLRELRRRFGPRARGVALRPGRVRRRNGCRGALQRVSPRWRRRLPATVDEVVLSVMTPYKKTRRNLDRAARRHGFAWHDPCSTKSRGCSARLAAIAADHGIAADPVQPAGIAGSRAGRGALHRCRAVVGCRAAADRGARERQSAGLPLRPVARHRRLRHLPAWLRLLLRRRRPRPRGCQFPGARSCRRLPDAGPKAGCDGSDCRRRRGREALVSRQIPLDHMAEREPPARAASRHRSGSIVPAAAIASAISCASLTRNPVTPGSTMSASAPAGNATTGVPQASASIATSELVSATRLGTSRQRAARQQAALAGEADRAEKARARGRAAAGSARRNSAGGPDTGTPVRRSAAARPRQRRRVERQVKALLRADPAQRQREIALGMPRLQPIDRNAVRDRRQHVRQRREGPLLRRARRS